VLEGFWELFFENVASHTGYTELYPKDLNFQSCTFAELKQKAAAE
jgi:hypothetical protein